MVQNFKNTADWDDEAKVFTSASDIPGLVVDLDTFEDFVSLVEALAPQMPSDNIPQVMQPYHFNIEPHRSIAVA